MPIFLSALFISLCVLFATAENASAKTASPTITVGAQLLLTEYRHLIEEKRVGIITNSSAVVGDTHIAEKIHQDPHVKITAVFGPEHGFRGRADAGEAVQDSRDILTGAPVYSLYGRVNRPTKEMLEDIDVLVFDMQDVGARFYTYPATMGRAMVSAAEAGIPFVVLDRPNPLGGIKMEGFIRDEAFISGIGLYPTPVTHGMTIGELALMIKGEKWHENLEDLDLHVVPMKGWRRNMLWMETGLEWTPPSPNIPDPETALVYPGTCFFEATTASEGRGTYEPFIQVGAAGVDGKQIADALNRLGLKGLSFSAVIFTPESIPGMAREPKLAGIEIEGVKLEVTHAEQLEPVAAGMHLLKAFYDAREESESDNFFITAGMRIRAGNEVVQRMIEHGADVQEIIDTWQNDIAFFSRQRTPYLLYN